MVLNESDQRAEMEAQIRKLVEGEMEGDRLALEEQTRGSIMRTVVHADVLGSVGSEQSKEAVARNCCICIFICLLIALALGGGPHRNKDKC